MKNTMASNQQSQIRSQTSPWLLLASGLLCGLLAVAGCNRYPDRAAVSGTIAFADGKPIVLGQIEFTGLDQALVTGATIQDGQYYVPAAHGLKTGKYRVRIHAPEQGAKGPATALPGAAAGEPFAPKELIPPKYNSESEVEVTVANTGNQVFNFTIETN